MRRNYLYIFIFFIIGNADILDSLIPISKERIEQERRKATYWEGFVWSVDGYVFFESILGKLWYFRKIQNFKNDLDTIVEKIEYKRVFGSRQYQYLVPGVMTMVLLNDGKKYKGKLESINEQKCVLDIEGSKIEIYRKVIKGTAQFEGIKRK